LTNNFSVVHSVPELAAARERERLDRYERGEVTRRGFVGVEQAVDDVPNRSIPRQRRPLQ
jgi:hypothetical protein